MHTLDMHCNKERERVSMLGRESFNARERASMLGRESFNVREAKRELFISREINVNDISGNQH